jgi:hypothetical protein
MLIPSHASRVQHVQISEYLLNRNCMAVKSLHQIFYYHNKYLNRMKCDGLGENDQLGMLHMDRFRWG